MVLGGGGVVSYERGTPVCVAQVDGMGAGVDRVGGERRLALLEGLFESKDPHRPRGLQ